MNDTHTNFIKMYSWYLNITSNEMFSLYTHQLARSTGLLLIEFVKQRLKVIGLLDKVPSFQANGRTHDLSANP